MKIFTLKCGDNEIIVALTVYILPHTIDMDVALQGLLVLSIVAAMSDCLFTWNIE